MRTAVIFFGCILLIALSAIYFLEKKYKVENILDKNFYKKQYFESTVNGDDLKAVKEVVRQKYNYEFSPEYELEEKDLVIWITEYISTFDSKHAQGIVWQADKKKSSEIGWLAVKRDTQWLVPFLGKGIPTCSEIAQYSFPEEMSKCSTD